MATDFALESVKELSDRQLNVMWYDSGELPYLFEGIKRGLDWATNDNGPLESAVFTIISNDKEALDSIESFFDNYRDSSGVVKSESLSSSVEIPYSHVMKYLIDDGRFTGTIKSIERRQHIDFALLNCYHRHNEKINDSECIVLTCSATNRSHNAFQDALSTCFNVRVSMELEF